jgi:hypothetical protein
MEFVMKALAILLAIAILGTGAAQALQTEEDPLVRRVDRYLKQQDLKTNQRKTGCSTKTVPTIAWARGSEVGVNVRCFGIEQDFIIMFRIVINRKTGAMTWDREHFGDFRPVPHTRTTKAK